MDTETVITQLKADEGWSALPYRDSEGYLTIGYGFLIDHDRASAGMPREVGDYWLRLNVRRLVAELPSRLPKWHRYPACVQTALLNMSYQMGISGVLGFRNMISALDDGEYIEASRHALDSKWARQTPNRAKRVAAMIADAGS